MPTRSGDKSPKYSAITAVIDRLNDFVWQRPLATASGWQALLIRICRLLCMLFKETVHGEINTRAGSLVFTSLLSLVPLIAVSFSILKAFGVHNAMAQIVRQALQPIGDQSDEIASRLLGLVDNLDVSALGGFGFAALFITSILLILKLESALNYIWRVNKPRPLQYRIPGYLSVLLVGPSFVVAAILTIGSVKSSQTVQEIIAFAPVGHLLDLAAKGVPFLLVTTVFTIAYLFIPNRRVSVRAALLGGATAGLAWNAVGWVFADFVTSSPNYAAVYKSFAVLFAFIFWLFVVWSIVLYGAAVAFYVQHPERHELLHQMSLPSNRMREGLAVDIMLELARRHHCASLPAQGRDLVERRDLSEDDVGSMLDSLIESGLVLRTVDPEGFVVARDIHRITVADVFDSARRQGELNRPALNYFDDPRIDTFLARVDGDIDSAFGKLSLAELVGHGSLDAASMTNPREAIAKDAIATDAVPGKLSK